jgi:uncharacterized membrane protein
MADTTQTTKVRRSRFWEIDLLRTNAIVVMIAYHTMLLLWYPFEIHYTLQYLYPWFPLWFTFGGGTFIFLAGVSITIAYSRSQKAWPFVRRGLQIFAMGMGITLVTWLIPGPDYVQFGVLHFFGIAFMIAPFFLRFRFINLILGIALMIVGFQLRHIYFDVPWLFWLGLKPQGFGSQMDYMPLLPWFGLFLAGIFFGKVLYPQGNRRFNIPDSNNRFVSALTLPGRHPLAIYLAQWPAIIGALLAIFPAKVLPYFPPLPF